MSAARLLEVSRLSTEIDLPGGSIRPVDEVSFGIDQGETVCLVGESGCGKTILSRSLLMALPETARVTGGAVRLEGDDITAMSPSALRVLRGARVGVVPQDPMSAFDPLFRVGDQIVEAIRAHDDVPWQAAADRMLAALRDVGLPDPMRVARSLPSQLSGGMNQRALIAMALATNPVLLVADEPTTALDVTVQAQVLELLAHVQSDRGLAVLLITHDMGVAAMVADRILVMYAGRVVEEGPVDAVFSAPRHPYTAGLIASARASLELDRPYRWIAGAPPDLQALPPGCPFAPRCEFAREECTAGMPAMVEHGAGRAACVLSDEERSWLS